MIGSLRGTLIEVSTRKDAKDSSVDVLIEVGGVGYRAIVSGAAISKFGGVGENIFVYIHTHVREDALVLYGFVSKDERLCFEALISAHGVGPSVAMAILSVHSPNSLARVIATNDADALSEVPGIGKKTAAKLIIELTSRLQLPVIDLDATEPISEDSEAGIAEVRAALAGLGYGTEEIRIAMKNIPDGTPETQLRDALRRLAVTR